MAKIEKEVIVAARFKYSTAAKGGMRMSDEEIRFHGNHFTPGTALLPLS